MADGPLQMLGGHGGLGTSLSRRAEPTGVSCSAPPISPERWTGPCRSIPSVALRSDPDGVRTKPELINYLGLEITTSVAFWSCVLEFLLQYLRCPELSGLSLASDK